jgi:hypothetical protein
MTGATTNTTIIAKGNITRKRIVSFNGERGFDFLATVISAGPHLEAGFLLRDVGVTISLCLQQTYGSARTPAVCREPLNDGPVIMSQFTFA